MSEQVTVGKREVGLIALGFFTPIVVLATWILIPRTWTLHFEHHDEARAVEHYRDRFGRWPDPSDEPLMRSLGFDYGAFGPIPDLKPVNSQDFELIRTSGFDDCFTYTSSTDEWTYGCTVAP